MSASRIDPGGDSRHGPSGSFRPEGRPIYARCASGAKVARPARVVRTLQDFSQAFGFRNSIFPQPTDSLDVNSLYGAGSGPVSSFGFSATPRPTTGERVRRAGARLSVACPDGSTRDLSASGRFRRYCVRDQIVLERVPVLACAFRCTFVTQLREV